MSWSWPFGKTYKHRCKDGSVKLVYRNVDDAFPLHIEGWQAHLNATAEVKNTAKVAAGTRYSKQVGGLLVRLDERNQSLMMAFRAAYMTYMIDPCHYHAFFAREIARLNEEQNLLQSVKLKIDSIIALAKMEAADQRDIVALYITTIQAVGGRLPGAQAAQLEITALRDEAKEWSGGANAG